MNDYDNYYHDNTFSESIHFILKQFSKKITGHIMAGSFNRLAQDSAPLSLSEGIPYGTE